MKTPGFWYKKTCVPASLLSPLSLLYATATKVRRCYAKPYTASTPVICIGNIVAGGAGKTPTTLALIKILKEKNREPVVVLRGYGGQEKGPTLVDPIRHNAVDVGDEALLLAKQAPCWIGQNRKETIQKASESASLILMDDGLQNPTITPTQSLLVIDGATGIGNGHVLPAGPLREKLSDALKRVHAVIMIGEDQQNLSRHLGNKPVLQAKITARLPADFPKTAKFIAFSGIARPEKFWNTARETDLDLIKTIGFADHHTFTEAEIEWLVSLSRAQDAILLTTEKDWVRLPDQIKKQVKTLPIELIFNDPHAVSQFLCSI